MILQYRNWVITSEGAELIRKVNELSTSNSPKVVFTKVYFSDKPMFDLDQMAHVTLGDVLEWAQTKSENPLPHLSSTCGVQIGASMDDDTNAGLALKTAAVVAKCIKYGGDTIFDECVVAVLSDDNIVATVGAQSKDFLISIPFCINSNKIDPVSYISDMKDFFDDLSNIFLPAASSSGNVSVISRAPTYDYEYSTKDISSAVTNTPVKIVASETESDAKDQLEITMANGDVYTISGVTWEKS